MTVISSGIYPINPNVTDGTQLAGYINELVEAINSNQSSPTRPPIIAKGGLWTKTLGDDDVALMIYDGTKDTEIAKMVAGNIVINNENVYTKEEIDAILENFEPSGGGGGNAQPPVAFNASTNQKQVLTSGVESKIIWDGTPLDTDSAFDLTNNEYVVPKDGIYQINYQVSLFSVKLKKGNAIIAIDGEIGGRVQLETNTGDPLRQYTAAGSKILELKKNQTVSVLVNAVTSDGSPCETSFNGQTNLSGHMVSSITEGEVKEKEAVAFNRLGSGGFVTVPDGGTYEFGGGNEFEVPVDGWYSFGANIFKSGGEKVNALFTFNGIENLGCYEVQKEDNGFASISIIKECVVGEKVSVKSRAGDGVSNAYMGHSNFHGHLITGQSSGASSGGGDYTPEDMVWEDKLADREIGTVYTNTNDVPLYVQIYTHANSSGKNAQMWIDGEYFGATGNTSGDTQQVNTNFYVIPSKSTYELRAGTNTPELKQWHEARMPVAVGTGGKTVSFKALPSANQTTTANTETKVNIDRIYTDPSNKKYGEDSDLVDGKFKPSVAGYYQVNASISQACVPNATRNIAILWKNGENYSQGSDYAMVAGNSAFRAVNSDLVYLNGTTDYLELYSYMETTGTCVVGADSYLSAVLVSGGSASGDSATLESLGIANHDKVTVDENGNVGIGTDSPADFGTNFKLLEVKGSEFGVVQASSNSGCTMEMMGTNTIGYIGTRTDHPLSLRTEDTERLRIDSTSVNIHNDGIKYEGIGSVNVIAFKWNGNVVARIDNSLDVTLASTTRVAEVEEAFDKKLAIKDKLIEKLSARLDELEKKLKK